MSLTAGITTITTVGTTVFDVTNAQQGYESVLGATTVVVACPSDSANGILVSVGQVMDENDFYPIAKGGQEYFRNGNNGITKITVKGDGGAATVKWSIVAKTWGNE